MALEGTSQSTVGRVRPRTAFLNVTQIGERTKVDRGLRIVYLEAWGGKNGRSGSVVVRGRCEGSLFFQLLF